MTRKRLLITGHDGFVGQRLQAWLPSSRWADLVEPVRTPPGFDLRDAASVAGAVRGARADWVLHLAAQSHVPASFADPAATLEVNTVGTARLLGALRDTGFSGRLLYVSSADVYGQVTPERLPLDESAPPNPSNPYAVSKAAAEMLCRQWRTAHGLDAVIARPFNHVGAGQRPDFALSGFARSIAEVLLGRRPPELPVGNLDVTRDFTDVLDICEGYLALLDGGRPGETYNLCSGQGRHLGALLRTMLERAGCTARVVVDPARHRPADNPHMVGSAAKAARDTGWQARRALEPALDAMIDYWKRELAK